MKAQICPVCNGKGVVPADFYPDEKPKKGSRHVKCRACKDGVIHCHEDYTPTIPYPHPVPYPDPYPYRPWDGPWYPSYWWTGTSDSTSSPLPRELSAWVC